ncbi:MAG: dihydroorotate dehydrogenase (quinone) [Saprospirales bacterium]|nr:dihydroorotate dehydrogenase (quinone) [Saprospirales bacterium]
MYKVLKPLLFALSAETAHKLTLQLLDFATAIPGVKSLFRKWYCVNDSRLHRKVFGLDFPNPVGLAAGFDKDGKHFRALANLGFGFIEIGTVTPVGQPGNPQPRLFRLPADEAVINRMGFNNDGVEAMVRRLKKGRPEGVIIGGNIGKNKETPNDQAVSDYEKCFEALFPYVDYFVVNVSSPNTPNLRALQDKKPLSNLLNRLQVLNHQKTAPKPILLKISPDLNRVQLDDIVAIVKETGIAGVIATNTTIGRAGLNTPEKEVTEIGPGGLSGKPLRDTATQVIRYLRKNLGEQVPIIGVGGIVSPKDALEKLEAGATLVQVYTGLIYEGPGLVRKINEALLAR